MLNRLSAWFLLGCDSAPTETLKRKVLNVNAAAWATVLLMISFHLFYVASSNPGLRQASWALLPFYPLVLLVLWLNHQGLHAAARWVLPNTVTALIAANMWTANGTWLGIHYYLMTVIVVLPVLFPLRQWPIPTALFGVNTALFIYCDHIGVPPAPEILTLDSGTTHVLRLLHVGTSVLAALVISLIGDWMASRNEHALQAMSHIDALTNLPNRRRMVQRLKEAMAWSRRSGQHGAVLFLDLDNFKSLNDVHGHAAGDLLLQEVARRLQNCLRETDVVARFGGDEFVVMLTLLGQDPIAARAHALSVAEKIRWSLAEPYRLLIGENGSGAHGIEHHCTASIGLVLFRGESADEELALKQADAAMYRAKEQGRNAICCHTPSSST